MAHAQKTDFVFQRNERVHLNRRGRQFSRLLAAEVYGSAVVMLDTPRSEVVWRVLATPFIRQLPLHFPSRASLYTITFQLDSTYFQNLRWKISPARSFLDERSCKGFQIYLSFEWRDCSFCPSSGREENSFVQETTFTVQLNSMVWSPWEDNMPSTTFPHFMEPEGSVPVDCVWNVMAHA
jgi:hypothetical protein